MNREPKVVLVGVGSMGSSMAKAWIDQRAVLKDNLTLIDHQARSFDGIAIYSDYDHLHERIFAADFIVLAVKPQDLESSSRQIYPHLSASSTVVSILAGVSLAKLSRSFNNHPKLIRAMPNLGASICQSMTAYVGSDSLNPEILSAAELLLKAFGLVEKLDSEEMMDAWCAVAGSGPGFIIDLIECFVSAAQKQGFSANLADQMLRQTFLGTALLVSKSEQSLSELKGRVASKGGTTAAGLAVLAQSGLAEIFDKTLQAATLRAKELNKL